MDDIDIARRAISDTIEALKQVVAKMKPMSDKKFGDFTIREIATECSRRKHTSVMTYGHPACWLTEKELCPFWGTFVCRDLKPHEWLSKLEEDETRKDHGD